MKQAVVFMMLLTVVMGINVSVNGEVLAFTETTGVPFVDVNQRTQVPFRIALEAFGAKVGWEAQTQTVLAEKAGVLVKVPIGSKTIYKNDELLENDAPAVVINGRTFVPIRAVIEALGGKLSWDSSSQTVLIEEVIENIWPVGQIIQVEANPEAGFYWPYYLFIPHSVRPNEKTYLLVNPNNQPIKEVPYTETLQSAYGGVINHQALSEALKLPILVPVFPGTNDTSQITSNHFHSLNSDALMYPNEPLKRVDLQLLAMTEDAIKKLKENKLLLHDQMVLTGFSDAGNFVNRFTALHPERVKMMIAGGINVFMFPVAQYNEFELPYPLGLSDYDKVLGKPFDKVAYDAVAKFIYRGSLDLADPIYGQNYMDTAQRDLVINAFSREIPQRLVLSKALYESHTKNMKFVIYEGVAHWISKEMEGDIRTFIEENF